MKWSHTSAGFHDLRDGGGVKRGSEGRHMR